MNTRPMRARPILHGIATIALAAASTSIAAAQDTTRLELFDVRDLLDDLNAGITRAKPDDEAPPESERIARFLRTFAEPKLRDDEDIRGLRSGTLVARGTEERLAWIRQLLRDVRAKPGAQIDIQTSFVELTDDAWQRHIKPILDKQDPTSVFTIVLSDDEATRDWRVRMQKEEGAMILTAPRLLTYPLQRATLSAGETITYIKDYATKEDERKSGEFFLDGQKADADGRITGTLFDGVELETTAATLRGDRIALQYRFSLTDVKRPIPEFTTTTSAGNEVTIQLPESTKMSLEKRVVIPNGALALTSAPLTKGGYRVLLMQATRLDEPAAEPAAPKGK